MGRRKHRKYGVNKYGQSYEEETKYEKTRPKEPVITVFPDSDETITWTNDSEWTWHESKPPTLEDQLDVANKLVDELYKHNEEYKKAAITMREKINKQKFLIEIQQEEIAALKKRLAKLKPSNLFM